MPNLKNYTSEVPASTSISRIEKYLIEAGATDISKKYEGGICTAITFRVMMNLTPLFFKLPAKVDACYKILRKQVIRPIEGTEKRLRAQSERTAWKILSDWAEIQLSMIQLEQAEMIELFLPYVYDPVSEETYYDKLKQGGFKALSNG